ncbi:glycoside hydrolase family 16 protein [Athelia psychrophila]|uniref:Glycoside hydrolase family 16 protein n=1 Tax=Athelia psychrophila TaxID=1759441 RepID=A0A166AI00_9AGAM|nr:glycoside hydrolase family 16 protein [Fibularhizoctonia sp. CBS 109695]
MLSTHAVAISLALALAPATVAHYHLADTFIGHDFINGFNWETFDDPTHGRVNFVDQPTALSSNLSFASSDSFVMRADSTQVVAPASRGRDSIRITSHNAYNDSMIVLDLAHMPEGCATWPAFWTISQGGPWPNGGEIDIIEGVNLQPSNLVSLHTTGNCSMGQQRSQTGSAAFSISLRLYNDPPLPCRYTVSPNCDASLNNNQGCGTQFTAPNSFGSSFNQAGGGWYVMQKSATEGINVWFWSRNDHTVPAAVHTNNDMVYPDSTWGSPGATFPSDTCDYASHFNAHQIIFDLTLCGDWAGSVFPSSGCGSGTCTDFVNNNPSAFLDAFWEVNALRVYTLDS